MSLPLFILTDKLYETNTTNKLVSVENVPKPELIVKKDIKSPRLLRTKSKNKSMDNLIKYQLGWSV